MDLNARIYVAGSRGLLGLAIARQLNRLGYHNVVDGYGYNLRPDLTNLNEVLHIFEKQKPEYVFLAAGRVGDIGQNTANPVEFLDDNLRIELNIMCAACKFGVKKLLFFSSNCCYPRLCSQPMREEYLMTGPLEPTNEAYAIAKIAGMKLSESYNKEYRTQFYSAVLASLYGPNGRTHVIADMIRKFHHAKKNLHELTFYGDGSPLREFMYKDDAADAAIFLMQQDLSFLNEPGRTFINVGTSEEISMADLAQLIAEIVGYTGDINWDTSKPNGMPRKLLDSERINSMGWRYQVGLRDGIERTYQWYLSNIKSDS